jgi:hypothetical protein
MRAGLLVSAVTAGLLTVALPAAAKGPASASIEGPGLAGPLVMGYSDDASSVGTEGLGGLLNHGRLGHALIAATAVAPPREGTLVTPTPSPPPGRLGSRYAVTYDMGPDGAIRQDLYPYAEGGPVAHLPAGQRIGTRPLGGGWARADVALLGVLTNAGLPVTDPAPPAAVAPVAAGASWPVRNAEWLLAGLVALCLAVVVWITRAAHHRRKIAEPAPGLPKVHEPRQPGQPGREAP